MTAPTPLEQMTASAPAVLWNDSADPRELGQSIAWGAVGATCNPVIAVTCVKADLPRWQGRMREIAATRPTATESQIGWQVVEEVSLEAARMLEPAFERHQGRNGRLSMQTDPRLHRDATGLADQAVYFSGLAKNIIVKIPATATGLRAIEDATARGVSVNVTVSFSVPQAVATAEAIERGLAARERAGEDTSHMGRCPRRRRHRPGIPSMGWSGGLQTSVRDLRRARVPCPTAVRGLPNDPALERVRRR